MKKIQTNRLILYDLLISWHWLAFLDHSVQCTEVKIHGLWKTLAESFSKVHIFFISLSVHTEWRGLHNRAARFMLSVYLSDVSVMTSWSHHVVAAVDLMMEIGRLARSFVHSFVGRHRLPVDLLINLGRPTDRPALKPFAGWRLTYNNNARNEPDLRRCDRNAVSTTSDVQRRRRPPRRRRCCPSVLPSSRPPSSPDDSSVRQAW